MFHTIIHKNWGGCCIMRMNIFHCQRGLNIAYHNYNTDYQEKNALPRFSSTHKLIKFQKSARITKGGGFQIIQLLIYTSPLS